MDQKKAFNIFAYTDDISISRVGKQVTIKGKDGSFQQSDTVESNLLYEILKQLKRK